MDSFHEDRVHMGRMDCMRRWRIQGTLYTSVNILTHSTLKLNLYVNKNLFPLGTFAAVNN